MNLDKTFLNKLEAKTEILKKEEAVNVFPMIVST